MVGGVTSTMSSAGYWEGFAHGVLLLAPVLLLMIYKWREAAASREDDQKPVLGCV